MTNLSNIAGFQAPSASAGVLLSGTANTYNQDVAPGYSNPSGSTSYSGFMPAAAPTSSNLRTRNTFAHWAMWRSSNSNASGFIMSSFDIDRSTGQITTNTANQSVWTNTSGASNSTTYLIYDPTHGCFFSGGHNSYPGYNSHVFGYTYGRLAANGVVSGGASYSNADHGYNGTYCGCLPSASGGTNYFLTGGYNGSGGSYAGNRIVSCSSGGASPGGFSNSGSWTSSSQGCHHVYQPDHQGYGNNEVISLHATSFNNPNYGYSYIPSGSSGRSYATGYSSTYISDLIGANSGNTAIHNSNNNFFYINHNAGGTSNDLVNGYPDFSSQTQKGNTIGIGDDCFLYLGELNSGHAIFFKMDNSTRQPIKVARVPLVEGAEKPFLPAINATQFFVVYENDTDTHPKWLITCKKKTGLSFSVTSQAISADFDALKA
tara:strand:+ start:3571 stop:4863 length:1293 start_codon:yes stop_codon:yes gene_type:complete